MPLTFRIKPRIVALFAAGLCQLCALPLNAAEHADPAKPSAPVTSPAPGTNAQDHIPVALSEAGKPVASVPAIATRPSDDRIEVIEEAHRTNRISNLDRAPELNQFQLALEAARKLRASKEYARAETQLIQILEGRFPDEIKRPALLEFGLLMHQQHSYAKAQQLYSEYVRRYDKDPHTPEVLLRQAYLYREMGLPELALSKYFAVMSTCLNLKLDEMEYYQKLVLRSQAEIAETYYLQGKFEEASDYYTRLLRLETADLDHADVLYKLVRCYMALDKHNEAAAKARLYLSKYPDRVDAPETRFLLASALKKLGHIKEALQEMDALLSKQHDQSKTDPQQWLYWQQRAGNDIANQLYREGDFLSALQVYHALAELNTSPEWQVPVWYQIGLVYEHLKQSQKAAEYYDKIVNREKEAKDSNPSAALKEVAEMAAWRKHALAWEAKARAANLQLEPAEQADTTLGTL